MRSRSVRYAEALRAAIAAAEPFRTMSTFNQERWDMTVLLLDAAPEIVAVLEACDRAECFDPAESVEGAYRCENCDGCRIRAALEDLNAKVPHAQP